MNFDRPQMLIVGGGTQVDRCGKEGNKRKKGESWGGTAGFDDRNWLGSANPANQARPSFTAHPELTPP